MTRGARRGWIVSRVTQIAFLLLTIGAWYYATNWGGVAGILLPDPVAVWQQFADVISSGAFLGPLEITLNEVVWGFALAAVAGLVFGYLISRSRYIVRVFEPLLAGVFAIPAILFFPLYALFFGLGAGSKIAFAATISFFPIVLNTIAGFSQVDQAFVSAARSMGASNYHMFRYVLLPSGFPVVLAGVRMGVVLAFLSVLGGETIASLGGLGHAIVESSEAMDTATTYAYIVIVILLAAFLSVALSRLERVGNRRWGAGDGQ